MRIVAFLFLLCTVTACSTVKTEPTLVGRYGPTERSYSPMWLELLPNGKFVLTSAFDTPVPGGSGAHGNEVKEEGAWRVTGSRRLVLPVTQPKLAAIYYVTILTDTPRGPGLFVSSRRDENADWRSLERFLSKEEPNQSLEPTPAAGTSAAEQPLVPAAGVAHL